MTSGITVHALDTDRGESYEISTHPSEHGMYNASVTGPRVHISGDPFALQELGQALLNASTNAFFAFELRVDKAGPLEDLTAAKVDLSGQSPEQILAHEGWINTTVVWGNAGNSLLPVGPDDWTGNSDNTATARLDHDTDLYFAAGHLHARSRCRHGRRHQTTLTLPEHLAEVRREAADCPGHEDHPA
ncbi:hypothetical protein ACODT3_42920 [Streptomyces sp. 4.24]|uniref:hypothetical protein n=1 Tax=Streptomyces tritrimontium TaxID=3406573 RepID=UPI003BB7B6A2